MLMRLRIEQETVLDRFFHGIGSQLIRPCAWHCRGRAPWSRDNEMANWPIPLTNALLLTSVSCQFGSGPVPGGSGAPGERTA